MANEPWPELVAAYVLANAATTRDEDMAAAVTALTGRTMTRTALRKIRQRLGIKKLRGRGVVGLDHS